MPPGNEEGFTYAVPETPGLRKCCIEEALLIGEFLSPQREAPHDAILQLTDAALLQRLMRSCIMASRGATVASRPLPQRMKWACDRGRRPFSWDRPPAILANVVLTHLAVERRAVDVQQIGGVLHATARVFQRRADGQLLGLLQRHDS